ncbi:MAG: DUF6142 family protein [Lachnospiraceae bacterium]|nr:DUF6142 family protein [Lachnospiraceae bacterium]
MRKRSKTRNYMFTSRRQSEKGVMSTTCGSISLVSFFVALILCFYQRGMATLRLGAVGLIAIIFSVVGFVLAILSMYEKDAFQLFPRCGLALSILSFGAWIFILYIGVVGI